jgi:hypothetical protein
MSDKALETVKLDTKDRKVLRKLAARLKASKSDVLRWCLRYYSMYGPCFPKGDTFPGEVLQIYGMVAIGPDGQEVHK